MKVPKESTSPSPPTEGCIPVYAGVRRLARAIHFATIEAIARLTETLRRSGSVVNGAHPISGRRISLRIHDALRDSADIACTHGDGVRPVYIPTIGFGSRIDRKNRVSLRVASVGSPSGEIAEENLKVISNSLSLSLEGKKRTGRGGGRRRRTRTRGSRTRSDSSK